MMGGETSDNISARSWLGFNSLRGHKLACCHLAAVSVDAGDQNLLSEWINRSEVPRQAGLTNPAVKLHSPGWAGYGHDAER